MDNPWRQDCNPLMKVGQVYTTKSMEGAPFKIGKYSMHSVHCTLPSITYKDQIQRKNDKRSPGGASLQQAGQRFQMIVCKKTNQYWTDAFFCNALAWSCWDTRKIPLTQNWPLCRKTTNSNHLQIIYEHYWTDLFAKDRPIWTIWISCKEMMIGT